MIALKPKANLSRLRQRSVGRWRPGPALRWGCTRAVCRVQGQRATRPRRRRISSPTAATSSLQHAATSRLAVAAVHSQPSAECQCLPNLLYCQQTAGTHDCAIASAAAGWDGIRCAALRQATACSESQRIAKSSGSAAPTDVFFYAFFGLTKRSRDGYGSGALTGREADSEDAQEPVHRDERKVDFPAAKVGQLRQCSL